jgi:mannose-6-phosphate isomerase-like protein (cupin superfamily)
LKVPVMKEQEKRHGIDPYLDWVHKEGLPAAGGYAVDLFAVETAPWARYGVKAGAVHLEGRGDFANMFVFDIPPGGATTPQRHLYEEVIYVLEGHGSTQVELGDGSKRSFEWGPRSLFAIPLNVKYRHFNGSGRKRALLASTTDLPLKMNAFHNERFIFGTDFDFSERFGKEGYYAGEGDLVMIRPGNHYWETNFVADLEQLELKEWGDRGAGGTNIMFALADGLMHAHISEMPVGTYKKGHRHFAGYHVMCVVGTGYSLLWFEGDRDFIRVDWKHGVVIPPADRQFHQHFNTSSRPARYLATGVGSLRYPFTAAKRRASGTTASGIKGAVSTSIKQGGDQIEYEDQDPRIHRLWLEEMRKNGAEPKMEKYFPAGETAAAD